MLVLVPVLIFYTGTMTALNMKVWAPEPLKICIAHRPKRRKELWFTCETKRGETIRFSASGFNEA